MQNTDIFIAGTPLIPPSGNTGGEFIIFEGLEYYKIRNYDNMTPFFMNIVSSSDQWMFISSSGGITAGRTDADNAIFPYYTVDKLTQNGENTGPGIVIHAKIGNKTFLWEPFTKQNVYKIERNLYKSVFGDRIVFQEVNRDLNLDYRYSWSTSDRYGFILNPVLINNGKTGIKISLISGIKNILPSGTSVDMQLRLSNLLNAYKQNEIEKETGIGIFSLSATITDLPEPGESLRATTIWQEGLDDGKYLLSPEQVAKFRLSGNISEEKKSLGRPGAYFVQSTFCLDTGEEKKWYFVAEAGQDHSSIINLINKLRQDRKQVLNEILADSKKGTYELRRIIGKADGLQLCGDKLGANHHFANTLYNSMRGGIFLNNYQIGKKSFIEYLTENKKNSENVYSDFINRLPSSISITEVIKLAARYDSPDLMRLCRQYLPLSFSRRHGDPSRPWNKFSIRLKNPDGTPRLDYQGNWRDIFQNWEALARSFPEYTENMIIRFLNATTADGYNPYRIHMIGVDWEKPDPSNPWSNIGYWSDHQIIYLQKLFEISAAFHPGALEAMIDKNIFVHVNVPYRIRDYQSIQDDPYETIEYDEKLDSIIDKRIREQGSDGQLISDSRKQIMHVSFTEKILILLLAKLSNFIPQGGLWMNTQRPEWNDANNALVGKGLSVVSICYLRRFTKFIINLYESNQSDGYYLSDEIVTWMQNIKNIFETYRKYLSGDFDNKIRKSFMDAAGSAADIYRRKLYRGLLSEKKVYINREYLTDFLKTTLEYEDHCIKKNKRKDGLYHSYNILTYEKHDAAVGHLYEMLEGQVAVLSSGLLDSEECLTVLNALSRSKMFREDQHSYLLYPDRKLPGFLDKNCIREADIKNIGLLAIMSKNRDTSLIDCDSEGVYHFNSSFKNRKDVEKTIDRLKKEKRYSGISESEEEQIIELFIRTFNHEEFTGRSGTFFGYEGLGSVYWHMVSKLLLAAQEAAVRSFKNSGNSAISMKLKDFYYEIRNGLGFNKPPQQYGAFPTDPYSHTPAGNGAKQPGMTGQVKEELITRLSEMGLFISDGSITFNPFLLCEEEFLKGNKSFHYFDVSDSEKKIILSPGTAVFTFCQIPVILKLSESNRILVEYNTGITEEFFDNRIPKEISGKIFRRSGEIEKIVIETGDIFSS